jgi:hypothetical protein
MAEEDDVVRGTVGCLFLVVTAVCWYFLGWVVGIVMGVVALLVVSTIDPNTPNPPSGSMKPSPPYAPPANYPPTVNYPPTADPTPRPSPPTRWRSYRVTHCYACKRHLDGEVHPECRGCGWIMCPDCGACGCGYLGL